MEKLPQNKIPLIDSYGRVHSYLRISITDRCDLRCNYCMPQEDIEFKPRDQILTYEELLRLTKIFASMGIDKVRITGGEPLVRRDIEKFIFNIAGIKTIKQIAMTTNATNLVGRVQNLKQAGLTKLNISLDTLSKERFRQITGRDKFDKVLKAIDEAMEAGFAPLKINCVVMGGINDDEILDFVELAKEHPVQVRFIEFMPFKDNQWNKGELVPYQKMIEQIQTRYDLKKVSTEERSTEVGKDYLIDGFKGSIAFVTSMTDDFCGTCNRIRLMADGSLKSCLFFPPEDNLKTAIQNNASDDELESIIRKVIAGKKAGHAPLEELSKMPNDVMTHIGG